ncbi:MAG: hypothetical protein KBE79_07195 [Sulfurospirillum sp.]|jgi:hypothetical protein|nr:hypothetical protein [Sulfurospirillum sp.]MBP9492975.1 hypothetical protein [Sulfurospirillum sp.]MBP9612160.1 hypothetical protein [Sulfurospirillum sp.]
MCKKLFFLTALFAHIGLSAGFLDDLIGKDRAFLESNGFKCTAFSCITKDQKYFNVKLLDDTIDYVEVYSSDKDEVYKVAFYLYQNDKLKNKEIDDAFYKALTKLNEKSKLAYDISKISDKFGDEALVTMTDAKRAAAFTNSLRDQYTEGMKQYIEQNTQK